MTTIYEEEPCVECAGKVEMGNKGWCEECRDGEGVCDTCGDKAEEGSGDWCYDCREKDECRCYTCKEICVGCETDRDLNAVCLGCFKNTRKKN